MEIHKIVLTGGPCAGKTTARSWIQNSFQRLGYRVLFIPEAYTELDCGGISSGAFRCNLDFQLPQFWLQLENEKVYERAAKLMDTDKVLIVCDRGTIDNKPYMTEDEFKEILRQLDMTEEEMLSLLSTDGMLVKRPLLIGEGFVLAGFKEKDWAEKL